MRSRPDSRSRLAALNPDRRLWPGDAGSVDDGGVLPAPVPRRQWVDRDDAADRPPARGWVPPEEPFFLEQPDELPPDPAESDAEPGAAPVDGHRVRKVRHSPHQVWGRVAQRWVPEPLRDARVDPGAAVLCC